MKKIFIVFSIILLLIISCKKEIKEVQKYFCPMHPNYISDKPGDCPICGMKLVPLEKKVEEKKVNYTCPMHPEIVMDKEGKCPKCGMDLVPMEEEKHKEHISSGLGEVKASPDVLRVSGVEKTKAYKGKISSQIKTVGIVLPDERRVKTFHSKVSGWIEKLYINFQGQYVEKGKPILSIYSQELYSAELEFLSAKRAFDEAKNSKFEEVKRSTEILYESSKKKLELFDVPSEFIKKIEEEGIPQKEVTIYSPFSGYVLGKEIFEGKRIDEGMELFKIVDLSRVWIEADVYEKEAPFISLNQNCIVELPFDETFKKEAKISYIYPYINEDTRTLKLRLDMENKELKLKPSMYVDVKINLKEVEGIIVPSSSIVDTGLRKVIFVEKEENAFVGREVEVGLISEEKALIISGIDEGEFVASKGAFLLDSEARFGSYVSSHKH